MSNNLFSGQSSTSGSLFGQQSSNNGGSNNNQQSNTTSNPFGGGVSSAPLFGGAQNQGGSTQSPFASSASAPAGSSGFSFGNNKPEEKKDQGNGSANGFNMFSTPNKESSQGQTSSLFGQQTSSTSSAFGNASTTPAGPPPSNSLFGNLGQTQKSTTSLFGSAQQNSQQSDQSSQKSSNLFANSNSAPLFSTTPASGTTNQLFGKPMASTTAGTPIETPKSLFGTTNSSSQQTSAPPSNSLFATSSSTPVTKPGFSFPALGQNIAQSSGQATPTTTAADKPSPFLGNTAATSSGTSSSLFASIGQTQNGQASEAQQTKGKETTAPATNLFAGLNQKKDDQSQAQTTSPFAGIGQNKDKDVSHAQDESKKSSAPSFSLFGNANQNKDKEAAATSAPAASSTTATTGATATAPGTSTASSAGIFGSAPKTQQDTSAPKTTEASGLGTSTLGASTAGPAPTPQSRLKNKSMDEIITRWATDLSKYQKEFQAQAEKVAAWDRILLENSNAITTLYSKTYHAERDTAEVQKQLSAVESHQDELSHWLDRYEREVDEMMARQVGQGESLQGPDQERERTYKIAGRVSERLDEMGKDLTSMIDEINEASATISKTSKPDDPLSQIVRVLNGHLSQLQLIDQGAAELRGKIDAVQKEKSRLGSRTNGSFANSDVDNFYRSYMRRG